MKYKKWIPLTLMALLCTYSAHSSEKILDLKKQQIGVYRFEAKIPNETSGFRLELVGEKENDIAIELLPVKKEEAINAYEFHRPDSSSKWERVHTTKLIFWPQEAARASLGVEGLEPKTYKDELLQGVLRYDAQHIALWIEGRLVLQASRNTDHVTVITSGESKVENIREVATKAEEKFLPVELAHLLSAPTSQDIIEDVPFNISENETLSLEKAGWPEAASDPSHFTETYDGGTYFLSDHRVPLTQVPKADYVAAYVLARADADNGNILTLRLGRRVSGAGVNSQVLMRDYQSEIPRGEELQLIKIPLHAAFSQYVEGDIVDMELTKEIRLARRTPDPNRYRWRPLGVASGVKIAGVTLELSPLQLKITASEPTALFEEENAPGYSVQLKNITKEQQVYKLSFLLDGKEVVSKSGHVPPMQMVEEKIALPVQSSGYYPFTVELHGEDKLLLTYEAAFGVLPKDERKHREIAPWGTWAFTGEHFTPTDNDLIGSAMYKLGLRYGMFNTSPEERAKYKVIKGNHFKVGARAKDPKDAVQAYEKLKEEHPDLLPDMLIFHEDSISGSHVSRTPDIFHDHPPYKLNDEEQERFDQMWDIAMSSATAMRAKYPDVKIHVGNGPIPLREEMYRHKFPSELFDTGGNENPTFGRLPETQPPDPIGNNASLWMDRQLLDAYGYQDKKVSQAHETIYPSTNPGNLSYKSHTDYLIRNILHSMAWEMPRIRPGGIADAGSSYYHSNWGGVGLLTRRPDIFPKPAAVAIGVFTQVFDGTKYVGFLDTGSESAYLLHFSNIDKKSIYPFWVVRGERDFHFKVEGSDQVECVDIFGKTQNVKVENNTFTLKASASPSYVILPENAKIESVQLGAPHFPDSGPEGKVTVIHTLDSLDGFRVLEEKNPLLEYYNTMTPRRKGNFTFEAGKEGIKVFPNPIEHGKDTMPMYAELEHTEGVLLPGKPDEIGLQVEGNSAWGRIIFELEDASGQRWTSIGSKSRGGSEWMADWLGKELAGEFQPGEISDWNTDDAWGMSRINFDGWHYIGIPLPGQYPGEEHHWPANSQWRWDKDGVVHYPLTLKKLIVELPEKTLHLTRYAPSRQKEIRLKNLMVSEGNLNAPKTEVFDYVERVQVTVD